MSESWEAATAGDVKTGDRIRIRGFELTVDRIENGMLGRPQMIAFIEDSEHQWFKAPAMADTELEIRRNG